LRVEILTFPLYDNHSIAGRDLPDWDMPDFDEILSVG
jgi:hypothetical protein